MYVCASVYVDEVCVGRGALRCEEWMTALLRLARHLFLQQAAAAANNCVVGPHADDGVAPGLRCCGRSRRAPIIIIVGLVAESDLHAIGADCSHCCVLRPPLDNR